jgi:outer membrane lipoprotein-sorting protein
MRRVAGAGAALLVALHLAVAAHAAGDKKKPAAEPAEKAATSWYAQRITHGDTGIAVEHYWSKGRKLHAELVVQGASIQTIVAGEFYTILDMTNQKGVRIRRSPAALELDEQKPNERPFGRDGEDLVAKGAEFVRSDNLADRPCRVLRITDEVGKREVWVSDDKKKLPLRIDFWARASGMHTTTDYIDWIADPVLSDAFFEPDPRIQLETIEYDDYVKRSGQGPVGPAPVLFSPLLHGK